MTENLSQNDSQELDASATSKSENHTGCKVVVTLLVILGRLS